MTSIEYNELKRSLESALEDKKNLQQRLESMIDHMPLVCNTFDKDFNIIDCNQKAVEVFEMKDKREFMERFFEILPPFQPDGKPSGEKAIECIKKAFEEGYYSFEWWDQKLDGEPMPSFISLVRFEWKSEFFVVAFIQDLREFYKFKETERIAKERLQTMLNASPLACFVIESDFCITELNQEFSNLFGQHLGENYEKLFSKLSPEYQPEGSLSVDKSREMLEISFNLGSTIFEWMFRNQAKELIPCEVSMMRVRLEGEFCIMAFIRDLREIKQASMVMKQLEMLAYTDTLTNIYNRRYFLDFANNELSKYFKFGTHFSIIMLDIDFFKKVNDTYGHAFGDEVLKMLAMRINSVVKRNTVVARYGGEEFIVLLAGVEVINAEAVAWRINKAVGSSPFNIKDRSINVTISCGVCSTEGQTIESLDDIINKADIALYAAKEAGRDRVVVYNK